MILTQAGFNNFVCYIHWSGNFAIARPEQDMPRITRPEVSRVKCANTTEEKLHRRFRPKTLVSERPHFLHRRMAIFTVTLKRCHGSLRHHRYLSYRKPKCLFCFSIENLTKYFSFFSCFALKFKFIFFL